jgi:protein tyrosine/serine phosphatase
MTAPADLTEQAPCGRRRSWLRAVLTGCAVGLLLAILLEAGRVTFGRNFHTVLPGRVYRCSQPSPARLESLIKAYGIRTVVNLRGSCDPYPWYMDECRVTARLDVEQEDICFSAGRLPAVHEVRRLIDALDHCAYPILFHCQHGADRTGLSSALVLMLYTDFPYAEARRQLGLRYGHVAFGRPANLDWFFDLYTDWLRQEGLEHSRAVFRHWCEEAYCPGPCRCRLEWLDPPRPLVCNQPAALRIRATNTSVQTWHLLPDSEAGIHVTFSLQTEVYRTAYMARAGLIRADVPPGGSIDLTLPLPSLAQPGHYRLLVDLSDEQQCCFYQTGSEPLEQELEVREQETAAGVQPGPARLPGLAGRLAPGR